MPIFKIGTPVCNMVSFCILQGQGFKDSYNTSESCKQEIAHNEIRKSLDIKQASHQGSCKMIKRDPNGSRKKFYKFHRTTTAMCHPAEFHTEIPEWFCTQFAEAEALQKRINKLSSFLSLLVSFRVVYFFSFTEKCSSRKASISSQMLCNGQTSQSRITFLRM